MTVAEIKAKLPEADIYELRDDAKYIIVLDSTQINAEQVRMIASLPGGFGNAIFLRVVDPADAVRILEVRE